MNLQLKLKIPLVNIGLSEPTNEQYKNSSSNQ